MNDWISSVIELQPDARKLEEHMRFVEYDKAYVLALKMQSDLQHLRAWIMENAKKPDVVYHYEA